MARLVVRDMTTERDNASLTGPDSGRLDSWKEIASHLGRSTRTVQRWEKEEGLPVYRRESPDDAEKPNQRQVFAYKSEIDSWWRRFAGESAAADLAQSTSSNQQHSRLKHRLVIAALAVAIVGVVVWQIERGQTEAALQPRALLEKIRDSRQPLDEISPDGEQVLVRREDRTVWLESVDGSATPRSIAAQVRGGFLWSPDGNSVVLSGLVTEDSRCVTRVLNLNTSTEKDLWECGRSSPVVQAWRPSGKELLVRRDLGDRRAAIGLVNIETGESTELFEDRMVMYQWQFSPDGQMLAYTAGRDGSPDIFVRHISDRTELRITDHPAPDVSPTWSPDGTHLLFFSSRTGSRFDLWTIPVTRGGVVGRPRLVQELGLLSILGAKMTAGGSLLYTSRPPTTQLAVLPIHPASGAATGPESSDFLMGSGGAAWVDNGNTLRYNGDGTIERDVASGREQQVRIKIPFGVRLVAESDDRDPRVFWGAGPGGVVGFYELNDDYTQARLIREDAEPVNPPVTLSPDGTEVLYEHRSGTPPAAPNRPNAVVALRIEDGEVRELARSRGRAFARWSPDGSQIAYTDGACLTVVPRQGGEARQIICGPSPPGPRLVRGRFNRGYISWSPDGTKVAWTMSHVERQAIDIWIVDVATGAHHVVWTGEGLYESWPEALAWSPRGDLLAFDKNFQQHDEVWRLSNFWPPPGLRLPR